MDTIRVLRIVEYVGPRDMVEAEIEQSIHGSKTFLKGVKITATTLGDVAEILSTSAIKSGQRRSLGDAKAES